MLVNMQASEQHRKEISINENVFAEISALIGQVLTVKLSLPKEHPTHAVQVTQHAPVFPQRVVIKRGESPHVMTSSVKVTP